MSLRKCKSPGFIHLLRTGKLNLAAFVCKAIKDSAISGASYDLPAVGVACGAGEVGSGFEYFSVIVG